MTLRKKTKAPLRPERWKPWAQRVIAEMKIDLALYDEYIEKFEENLADVNAIQPHVDFSHHAGMMSRIDNSLRKLVGSHHATAMLTKHKEHGEITEGELVVLAPDWKEIIAKDYISYNQRGYVIDTAFSQKFWNAFKECLVVEAESTLKTRHNAIDAAISSIKYEQQMYMKNEAAQLVEIFKTHGILKMDLRACCQQVWLESVKDITLHVLAMSMGHVMLLGTDARTYIFKDQLFMLVDDKRKVNLIDE